MEKELKVALVLTAGGIKEIYGKDGKQLSAWYHQPFFKKRVKKLEQKGEVTVRYVEKLKKETIARLAKAIELFKTNIVSLIFCVGGYSPRRKKLGLKDSVEMMNEWLIANGADKKSVIGGDAISVDTGTNIEEFLEHLKKLGISQKLTIYLVTSWYHLFRSRIELSRALKKEKIVANIICVPAFPGFDTETLKYEYAWNLLTEHLKLFSLLSPALKSWWRKREYETRK
jgi:uncharacterized SAM-binding protein YcdF (DUF218 family)